MPDWALQLLVGGGVLAGAMAGIKKVFTVVYDAWVAKEKRVETLQDKVQSLLMDAIAREREHNAQQADRIAMDAKQNEVIITATTALKEAAVLMAKIEKGAA